MDYYKLAFTLNSNKLNGIKLKMLTDILVEAKITNSLLSKLVAEKNGIDASGGGFSEQDVLRKEYTRDILTALYANDEELPDEIRQLMKDEE
ncbi:hypothetical protein QTN47_16810 [Danxiaibacter flavus]|uniref:Uncharacterized protein n=1 Tax=Danxiaibacter flavus TaxID=3049108 RepID=A0ABV3ZGZ6_9BACT|nr:hypothetical protein QNM32_16820 [Chitinophagaceae bacterium DXS]